MMVASIYMYNGATHEKVYVLWQQADTVTSVCVCVCVYVWSSRISLASTYNTWWSLGGVKHLSRTLMYNQCLAIGPK